MEFTARRHAAGLLDGSVGGDGQMPTPPPDGLVSDLVLPEANTLRGLTGEAAEPASGPALDPNATPRRDFAMAGHGRNTENADRTTTDQAHLEAVMGGGINSGPPAVAHVSPETNTMNVARLAALDSGSPAATSAVPIPTRSALSFERFCQIMNCQVYFNARTSNKAPWTGRLEFSTTGASYEDVTAETSEAVVELILNGLCTTDYSSAASASDQPDMVEEWRLLRLTAPLLVPGFIEESKAEVVPSKAKAQSVEVLDEAGRVHK